MAEQEDRFRRWQHGVLIGIALLVFVGVVRRSIMYLALPYNGAYDFLLLLLGFLLLSYVVYGR